jgi:hypothetical protein
MACRSGAAARLLAGLGCHREPTPGDVAGEAELVEEPWLVPRNPRREDLALPRAGGGLEALELADDRAGALHAVQAGPGGGVLPAQEEAEEVGGGHRLDLPPEATQRHPVDAGQGRPVAPVGRFRRVRLAPQEGAAQHEPLRLQLVQPDVEVACREAEPCGEPR